MMPEQFRRWSPSPQSNRPDKHDARRGSPAERGYDWTWQKLSAWWRREHPFCAECSRHGRVTLGTHTDHIVPVTDAPELRLDKGNLQTLCDACEAPKRRMEAYARAAGKIYELLDWCKRPETRPRAFAIRTRHPDDDR